MYKPTNNLLIFIAWLMFTLVVFPASGDLLHDVRDKAQRNANANSATLSNL